MGNPYGSVFYFVLMILSVPFFILYLHNKYNAKLMFFFCDLSMTKGDYEQFVVWNSFVGDKSLCGKIN